MRRASLIGVAVAAAVGLGWSGVAPAAGKARHKHSFSAVLAGAQVSTNGNRFETVYRVIRSPDGAGAAV